ncbi:MAG TPA: MFS transporter, partial [bacterium]|nr:MFS transporter [bacterium]
MTHEPTYFGLIRRKGFSAFLATQFLGAMNDNLLKYTTIFLAGAGMLSGASGNNGQDVATISFWAILPSLFFTSVAGYLADNFEKRKVLIATKAWEIGVMLLAWLALRSGSFHAQLAVLFLLATQFTFFGPAKYGSVPELVGDGELSRANGLLEMSTFLAILLGSVLAAPLFKRFSLHLDVIAGVMLAVAVLGSLVSLAIGPTPRPRQRVPFRASLFWSEVVEGTRTLYGDRRLWLTNLGATYFWFQAALVQMTMVVMGQQLLRLDQTGITYLFMALALGIGGGSMMAGRWSGQKVELGLVPLGSLGMGVFALALALNARSHPGLVIPALVGIGFSAGLFVVPLNALLQQKAEAGSKGRIQAAANFFSTLGLILASLVLTVLSKWGLPTDRIMLLAGLGCFAMTTYLVALLPEFLVRFSLWLATHSVYSIKIKGQEHV